jgi:hypothetical protein
MPRSGIVVGCALPSGEAREADRARSPVGAEDLLEPFNFLNIDVYA